MLILCSSKGFQATKTSIFSKSVTFKSGGATGIINSDLVIEPHREK
jgi:hypothetical protein